MKGKRKIAFGFESLGVSSGNKLKMFVFEDQNMFRW